MDLGVNCVLQMREGCPVDFGMGKISTQNIEWQGVMSKKESSSWKEYAAFCMGFPHTRSGYRV